VQNAAAQVANAAVAKASEGHSAEIEIMRAQTEAHRKRADELEAEKAAERQKAEAEKSAFEKEMRDIAARFPGGFRASSSTDTRFNSNASSYQAGRPIEAAHGVKSYLHVDNTTLNLDMAKGIQGIEAEIEANGTETDKECLNYVLKEKAGMSKRRFQEDELRRDRNRDGSALTPGLGPRSRQKFDADGDPVPMEFDDFCKSPEAKLAQLLPEHVLALRLYSTEAFRSINAPLRDRARYAGGRPHPLPLTVMYITEGVGKLRAVEAAQDPGNIKKAMDLYRGMANLSVPQEFLDSGGTELAPMSTSADLRVALEYSMSKYPMLLRIKTTSFMDRGADITFLSAFPHEVESLYPPLTYLEPTGKTMSIRIDAATFQIVDVQVKR